MISLLGCFTVSILTFILPPILHFRLVTLRLLNENLLSITRIQNKYLQAYLKDDKISPKVQYSLDLLLTALGILISVVATIITTQDAMKTLESYGSC